MDTTPPTPGTNSVRQDGWWLDLAWLVVVAGVSTAWCLAAARELGGTFDETTYLNVGLERWRTGSTYGLMRLGTMPLPVDAQTLPLYLWERARGEPINTSAEFDTVLPWARAGTLVFWYLLLTYTLLGARALGGSWAGRLAVTVVALEPNFLGHASLATTDIALTACLMGLLYHFGQGRESGWGRRVGLVALWFALAVLAKVSGLVFGLLCMGTIEAVRLWQLRSTRWTGRWWPGWQVLKPSVLDFAQVVGLGMVLVFLYCGSDWKPQASFVRWAHGLPEGATRDCMVWTSENLCVFSNAGEGIAKQFTHNVRGHGVYIAGREDRRALWYYFPLLLTMKLSVPLLLAPAMVLGAWLWTRSQPGWSRNWAAVAALALLAFTPLCRVQIGIRFMLPLMALTAVGLSAAWVRTLEKTEWRRCLVGWTAAGVGLSAANALMVWPHGLCYVNRLWGGTENGYLQVSDASYDWGQGLKDLRRWHEDAGRPELAVWYFGQDPAISRPPFNHCPLHVYEQLQNPEEVPTLVRGRYLAVSTTLLYGSYLNRPGKVAREYFLRRRPVARTMTFLIYDLGEHQAAGEPPLATETPR